VARHVFEVLVRRQHDQIMPDAELSQQRIDCSNLYAAASATVPQLGGLDVIVTIWNQQRNCGETLDNLATGLWASESLKQFLQDKPGRDDRFAGFDRLH
jgi:hypothetical protein